MESINMNSVLRRRVDIILIITAAITAFANTLRGRFVFDDLFLIANNPHIVKFSGLTYWLTHLYMSSEQRLTTNYYRPLPGISFATDARLWGVQPFGFHLTNLLIFAITSVMLYLLLWRLFNNKGLALVAALLFAVHPVHTEPVAWISARPDLLCCLFLIVSLWLFAGWKKTGNGNLRILSVAAFLGAMLSKEITIVVLPLLYAITYLYEPVEKRMQFRTRVYSILPHAAVVALCLIARQVVIIGSSNIEVVPIFEPASFNHRLLGAPVNIVRYLGMLFAPRPSQLYYSAATVSSPGNPVFLTATAGLLMIFAALFAIRKRFLIVFWSSVWIFITLLPAVNIVQLPGQTMGERYVYIPSLGACTLVSFILMKLWESVSGRSDKIVTRAIGVSLLTAILAVLTLTSWQGNKLWADEFTIWSKVVKDHPDIAHAHNALGVAYLEKGLNDEAADHFKTAVKLRPGYAVAHFNIANTLANQGDIPEAVKHYRLAIKNDPKMPPAYMNLAKIHESASPPAISDAIAVLEDGLKAMPDDLNVAFTLGCLYVDQNDSTDKAIILLEKVVNAVPEGQTSRLALGKAYAREGKVQKAKQQFEWLIEHSSAYRQQAEVELSRIE